MKRLIQTGVLCAALMLAGKSAAAAEIHLIADQFTQTMPDGTSVTMWGFAEDTNANGVLDGDEYPSVPGPQLEVPPGDTELTVHLHNNLGKATSVVIPGQIAANRQPVFRTDGQGRQRVHSFTHEAAANGGDATYQWTNIRPGSHVYHSGTHPQVQVQMGLYGAVIRDATANTAYPGVEYAHSVSIFYSEIDPILHAAVADGTYGTGTFTSTVDYAPRYFLVNGAPFEAGVTPPVAAGMAGQTTLLRLFNMGLTTHVAMLQGAYGDVIAEDGFLYPYPRRQYSVSLPAAKTRDVLFTPPTAGVYPVFDRRLRLSSAGQPDSGLLTRLEVAAPADAPTAANDSYSTDEDTPLTIAAPGVLANDTSGGAALTAVLEENVSAGTLTLNSDGSFTYTPPQDFYGTVVFSYRADDGTLQSAPATVQITVSPVNDAPVAVDDSYQTGVDTELVVAAPGVLENDDDVDGDSLEAWMTTAPTNGTLMLMPDGSFTYSPNPGFVGTDSFAYQAKDGTEFGSPATVTITVAAAENQTPLARDDSASTNFKEPVTINVLSNDVDPDGTLDPATVTVTTPPRRGSAATNADGTITYTPDPGFRGSDAFAYTVEDDDNAESNVATVRVNVIK